MNPLLQVTKVDVIERQTFSGETFADRYILSAIEAYDIEGSLKRRAQGFVQALTPLWRLYSKESYMPVFQSFIDMEIGLEAVSPGHSAHVNHVIQEFVFGYNILVNCTALRATYAYEDGRRDPESEFGKLFFAWMAASLFHDVGYDVEHAPEEEAFRKKKNVFWEFMSDRALTANPLAFALGGPGDRLAESYILADICRIPGAPAISYADFQQMFLRAVPGMPGWMRYDHGVISALKYLVELEKLEHARGGGYLDWQPNRDAVMAMALHNFRYKKYGLCLSMINPRTLVAYLLIVSDEVQEWDRARLDADAELPEEVSLGRNARRNTDLAGIAFRDRRAFLVVDHRLKDPSLRKAFEGYLDEKIALQKKHYPVRVLFPELRRRLREEMLKVAVSSATSVVPVMGAALRGLEGLVPLVEVTTDLIKRLKLSKARLAKLNEIAQTETAKHLLRPAEPEPMYEVCVDHRIEGEPYLTVVFPL